MAGSGYVDSALMAVALALILVGVYSGLQNVNSEKLMDAMKNDTVKAGTNAIMFSQGLNTITPSWRIDWLPPKGKYFYILEDIPYPDATDFVAVTVFAMIIFLIVTRVDWFKSSLKGWVLGMVLLMASVVSAWVIWKVAMYWLYYAGCQGLGMSVQECTATRISFLERVENFGIPILILAALSAVVVIRHTGGAMYRLFKG